MINFELENSVGSWISLPCDSIYEIYARSQFDWVLLDLEHGSISIGEIENAIRIISGLHSKPCLVRTTLVSDANMIRRALDFGASGLMLPAVEKEEDLVFAGQYAYYPPVGKRGMGLHRANWYGREFDGYYRQSKSIPLIAQIETKGGLENLELILKNDYCSAVFVGPYDLSASLGVPGDFSNPLYEEALQYITKSCAKAGKPVGIHDVSGTGDNSVFHNLGFNYLAKGLDALLLLNAVESMANMGGLRK